MFADPENVDMFLQAYGFEMLGCGPWTSCAAQVDSVLPQSVASHFSWLFESVSSLQLGCLRLSFMENRMLSPR